jgi:internalin A
VGIYYPTREPIASCLGGSLPALRSTSSGVYGCRAWLAEPRKSDYDVVRLDPRLLDFTPPDQIMTRCLPFCILLVLSSEFAIGQESIFPDKGLEAAVRTQVFAKRNNQEPLTKEDVAKISQVNGSGKKITNLAGLEHCVAIQQIDLGNNEIADLSPIAGLKLVQSLTLKNNKLQSIEPLKELTRLQYLDISGNQVKDIVPLAQCTALRSLDLSQNAIEDIQAIKQFSKLHSLYIKGNAVKDWSPLAQLRMLDTLNLSSCKIADVAFLKPLNRLKLVLLQDNQIKDLTPLIEMAKADSASQFAMFWRIYLKGNPIEPQSEQATQLKSTGARLFFE